MCALHPPPPADPDDSTDSQRRVSTLRLRLARLSHALLTGEAGDDAERDVLDRFTTALATGESSSRDMATLALAWVARSRRQSDQFAQVIFEGTQVDWRDDNRHLWRFIEAGDEEDTLGDPPPRPAEAEPEELPPRLYPEWDAAALAYRPDWVKVYDRLQPAGRAADIDALLARHHDTERDLKRLLDALKPQDRVRLRHQEEGSELDLDRAIAALGDLRAGILPDTRVQMSHRTDGRDIAVLLLMDLSASVNDPVNDPAPAGEGAAEPGETVLSLSRAAVALLAGAIATLGDRLAIVGFHSDTRQRIDLLHVKGFGEAWDDAPKARLAAVQGAFSTRMGAALRHAGELLSGRRADRRLLLLLTDGRPSDVDVADPEHLVADAAQAVHELDAQGLYTHCISLDAQADTYVGRVFGARCSVIDRVAQLPRRLPEIFLGLTR
jgi:nitric oxide reductase activation protein